MASISELLWLTWTNNTITNTQTYLDQQAEKFADMPSVANQFKILSSWRNSALNDVRNNIVNAYSVFEESTNPAFRQYIWTSLSHGKQILADIDKQKAGVETYYWPGWIAEKMIDEYITKYGAVIAQQAAWNQALAKNIWIRSGASASAVRAWVTAQQAADAQKIIQFQEKKVADLTNLYNTYNTLISQLRTEASTANQSYILQPLAQILDRQTQIASALVNNEAQLNQLRLSSWWWTPSWSSPLAWLSLDQWNNIMAWYSDLDDESKKIVNDYISNPNNNIPIYQSTVQTNT